jgi:hypothetical protein
MKLTSATAITAAATYSPFEDEAAARSLRVAQVISIVCLPPLLAIATLVALSSHAIGDPYAAARVAIISSFFIAIAPALYIAYLLRSNKIAGGVDLALKEERLRPYIVSVGSCLLGLLVLLRLSAPQSITLLAFCYAVNGAVMAVITQRWKISAHAAGAAMPLPLLVGAFGAGVLPLAAIVPVVCWARVRAQMHTVAQVSAGALLGLALTWLQLALIASRF